VKVERWERVIEAWDGEEASTIGGDDCLTRTLEDLFSPFIIRGLILALSNLSFVGKLG